MDGATRDRGVREKGWSLVTPMPPTQSSEVRAALRDASWYRTHRLTDTTTMRHVLVYHIVHPDDPYFSRCGRPIATDTEVPAIGVIHRCQRPGCKQAWPGRCS